MYLLSWSPYCYTISFFFAVCVSVTSLKMCVLLRYDVVHAGMTRKPISQTELLSDVLQDANNQEPTLGAFSIDSPDDSTTSMYESAVADMSGKIQNLLLFFSLLGNTMLCSRRSILDIVHVSGFAICTS